MVVVRVVDCSSELAYVWLVRVGFRARVRLDSILFTAVRPPNPLPSPTFPSPVIMNESSRMAPPRPPDMVTMASEMETSGVLFYSPSEGVVPR